MPDFVSFSDLFRVGRDEILVRNARLSRDAVEREGTDANALVAAGAAMADEVVAQLVRLCKAVFLDSAEGDDLDRLVLDRYGGEVVRKAASASLGTVNFSHTTAGAAAFSAPAGTRLSTADGIQFVTTAAATFAAGALGPVSAPVRSVLAGLNQNVRAATITSIVDAVAGPATLAVTNPAATAGGDDAESDASLRERARGFWTTARRGVLAAIEQGALAVGGVRSATAMDAIDATGRAARMVQLTVADAQTEAGQPSQLLAGTVASALSNVRAGGIHVQVTVAEIVQQAITLQLAFRAGANINQTVDEARATVVATVNELRPGQVLRPGNIRGALALVGGLVFEQTQVLSPAGNVVPTPQQVIRTRLGLVSVGGSGTENLLLTAPVVLLT